MIYLDNAATSWPKAPGVAQGMADAIERPVGNVGRSAHGAAMAAAHILYTCREQLQRVMPTTREEKTIFTRNATEALNTALLGSLGEGDVVLTTPIEHNAVARVLHHLQSCGVRVEYCACDEFGAVDVDDFRVRCANLRPGLAVFTAANNLTGAINPVLEMVQACTASGVSFVIDGAQALGELLFPSFPAEANGALCFSMHKGLLGPAGVGVMALYGAFAPAPLLFGGTGSRSDSVEQPDFLPDCYESGTPAIPAIAGSCAAITYVATHAEQINQHRERVGLLLWEGLSDIRALRMLSPRDNRVGVISLTMREGTISTLSQALFNHDVAVRSGYHCAPLAHRFLRTEAHGGAVRFSVGHTTTVDEIEQTVRVVEEAMRGT